MSDTSVHEPLRRIVVGTDFSPGAAAAVDAAVALAHRHEASVTIVHAVHAPPLPSMSLGLRELVERRLDEQGERVRRTGVPIETIFEAGRPWDAIREVVEQREADLVVVGARGHTIHERILLGSTSDRIVRTSRVPVLTVRSDGNGQIPGVTTVLVPVDFSEQAQAAADAAVRLIGKTRARLVLLHAWQPFVEYGEDAVGGVIDTGNMGLNELDDIEQQACHLLQQIAASVRSPDVQVETVVRQGYPVVVIEREARAIGADLIALGTHGRTGLSHLLLGSVAERVLHHAACPVLTVRRG